MNRFTVIERDGCILIEGALSVPWLSAISGMLPKKAVMAPQLANMLGANFAFGMPADVDALIASVTPQAKLAARATASRRGLSDQAAVWLAAGERGISSNTIFTALTGVDEMNGFSKDVPHDVSDFRRCWMLLDDVPELAGRLGEMATVSPAWAGLVHDWDLIVKTTEVELGSIRYPQKGARAEAADKLIELATGL